MSSSRTSAACLCQLHNTIMRMPNLLWNVQVLLVLALLTPLSANAQVQAQASFSFSTKQLCTLLSDGQVSCFVADGFDRILPPPDLPALIAVSSGDTHSCGITLDGRPVCWGDNNFGKVTPPPIEQPLVQINAGSNHTCAVDVAGEAICWGLNSNLQLEPPESARFVKVDAGFTSTCGILANGDITCFSTDSARAPLPLSGPFVNLDFEDTGVCGLTDAGDIRCVSGDPINPPRNPPPANGPYTDLAATADAVCGLNLDGALDCSFIRSFNQATIGTYPIGEQFLSIQSEETALERTDFSRTGPDSSTMCGERLDGSLQCWGSDRNILDFEQQPVNGGTNLIQLELDARIYSVNTVEIFWTPLNRDALAPEVEIFRNGELLDRVSAMFSYIDNDALADSTYQLQLVDSTGNVGPLSDVLSVNTETRTVLFNGEPVLTISNFTPDNLQDVITGINFVGLANGFIVSWDVDADLVPLVDGYQIRIGGESVGFTRSRLFLSTETSLGGACFEVIAVGIDGTLLDVFSSSSCS